MRHLASMCLNYSPTTLQIIARISLMVIEPGVGNIINRDDKYQSSL